MRFVWMDWVRRWRGAAAASFSSCPEGSSKGLADYRWFYYSLILIQAVGPYANWTLLTRLPQGPVIFTRLGMFWVGHLFNVSHTNSFLSFIPCLLRGWPSCLATPPINDYNALFSHCTEISARSRLCILFLRLGASWKSPLNCSHGE